MGDSCSHALRFTKKLGQEGQVGVSRGLVQGYPGLGGRDRTGTLPAIFSTHWDPSVLRLPTHAPIRAALLPGLGEQGEECPAESGDLSAGISGERNRLDCAFQGRNLWVFPSPEHQSMAWSCSQEWPPPTPEGGGHGDPGTQELGHWGRTGEDLQITLPWWQAPPGG